MHELQILESEGRQAENGQFTKSTCNTSFPFEATGTDLMGPVLVKIGRSLVKLYICIFSCLATRSVHLEVVESLESSSFIQAFRRFWNRRITKPKNVYSDNAGNFTAANSELNEGLKIWRSNEFPAAMAKEEMTWHFNPPLASHQGGFYETFFRIVRKVMRSVVQEATVSEFDLLTLVTEIERILNSRSITRLPDSPSDLLALIPAMILSRSLENDAVPGVFVQKDIYRRAWRKTQYLAEVFWSRWLAEYLPLLQRRQKWHRSTNNFKRGYLVLVINEQLKRSHRQKVVVLDVFPDKTGLVRRVRVKTAYVP